MNTLEKVNIAILLATITYVIAINSLLSGTDQIAPGLRWFITFLTSVGLFRLLIILAYWVIRSSDTLLAEYRQGRFLKGLWTYRYEVDGVPHMGIWRISQDLASISTTGYGIDATGRIDSHFRRCVDRRLGEILICAKVRSARARSLSICVMKPAPA